MSWPDAAQYNMAVQNPANNFLNGDLRRGQVERSSPLQLPRVMSGNFVSVYRIHVDNTSYAVRCFLRPQTRRQKRYMAIHSFFRKSLRKKRWMADFEFIERGILVDGSWFPIIKMAWVEGETLGNYVRANLKRSGILLSLANQFRAITKELIALGAAHCDLQQSNIMVGPDGKLRLVDYDAFFVPSLTGEQSLEIGLPHYQHPSRSSTDFGKDTDNFSALVIYLTLKALAVEPGLLGEHNPYDEDQYLLFHQRDYQDPGNSQLFRTLKQSGNREISSLATALQRSCQAPLPARALHQVLNNTARGGLFRRRKPSGSTRGRGLLGRFVKDQNARTRQPATGVQGSSLPAWITPQRSTPNPITAIGATRSSEQTTPGTFRAALRAASRFILWIIIYSVAVAILFVEIFLLAMLLEPY